MFENSHLPIRLYQWLARFCSGFQSIFLLILRIIWGYQFFISGLDKLQDLDGFAKFLGELNIWAPQFHAYFVSIAEIVCGLLLLIGLLSRPAGLLLAIIMFTAYSTAHIHIFSFEIFRQPTIITMQKPFPFLITSLLVLFFGPGKFSFDHWALYSVNQKSKYPY